MSETRRRRLYENAKRNRKVALHSWLYGWRIDPVKQTEIADRIDKNIADADEALANLLEDLKSTIALSESDRLFLSKFNAQSPAQVSRLLFKILDEPVKIRTEQGTPSAGKAALEHIIRTGQPISQQIAKTLVKRSENQKLKSAYINNLQGLTMVRPSAHVTAQVGQRWSYKDPALTTTPPFIRPMFVAHPGQWMVLADLAGAEFRSGALLSQCAQMIEAFNQGRDLHWETAEIMFGTTRDKLNKNTHRKMAKITGLAMNYATLDLEVAAAGIFSQIGHKVQGLTYNMVLGAVKRLAAARPEVIQHKRDIAQQIIEKDYVEEPFSEARRYFYGKPKDQEAWNFENQAQIAFVANTAAQNITDEFLDGEGLHLNKFDELILGGPDPARLAALLWKHLRQTRELNGYQMTYEIEIEVTKRWGQSVLVEPQDLGKWFSVHCPCGFHAKHDTVEGATTIAAKHYDSCPKMEGGIRQ